MKMIKELIKLANELDRNGYRDLASKLDTLLTKNKNELSKVAGEVPAWEAMIHEEHSPIEETPEYAEEQHLEEYTKVQMAERVAKLVVGRTPILGLDPDTGRSDGHEIEQKLADILSEEQHSETVGAIVRFIDGQPPGE